MNFKVVLLDHGYASIEHERQVIAAAGGSLLDAEHLPAEEAMRLCAEADGVLFRRTTITRQMMARFTRCRAILRYGVGTDNVDVEAATQAGIIVGHVPAYCTDEVSAHALALWLACLRTIVPTHDKVAAGGWDVARPLTIHRIKGKTFGLIGFGHIGRAVAQKLSGWGMRLLVADPYVDPSRFNEFNVQPMELSALLSEADYLSLHLPLLPETRHLIDENRLARMKPGAILINTARGPIVDQQALGSALNSGQLAAAGLDVFEEEPLPPDSPLCHHPRVVLTDHVAWYSAESQIELQKTAAEEIARLCLGQLPRSLVNPEVLRRLGQWEAWTPSESVRWQLKRLETLG